MCTIFFPPVSSAGLIIWLSVFHPACLTSHHLSSQALVTRLNMPYLIQRGMSSSIFEAKQSEQITYSNTHTLIKPVSFPQSRVGWAENQLLEPNNYWVVKLFHIAGITLSFLLGYHLNSPLKNGQKNKEPHFYQRGWHKQHFSVLSNGFSQMS